MDKTTAKFRQLRSLLLDGLNKRFNDKYVINGPTESGVPHILNIGFKTGQKSGLDGEMLLLNLDIEGICVSNGSACTSGAMEPSHVLKGIGQTDAIGNSSIRVSFGKQNTEAQVEQFLESLDGILKRMMKVAS
jgi:cysteine desulfurase